MTVGSSFYQSLEKVALPSGLQSLTFGLSFSRSLDKVAPPRVLQRLTFGLDFNQKLGEGGSAKGPAEFDIWPDVQAWRRWLCQVACRVWPLNTSFNQSLEKVTLPSGRLRLTLGLMFYQSWGKRWLCHAACRV